MNVKQAANRRYQPETAILSDRVVAQTNTRLAELAQYASSVAKQAPRSFFSFGQHQDSIRIAIVFSHVDNYRELSAFNATQDYLHRAHGTTHDIEYICFSGQNSHEYLQENVIDQVIELSRSGSIDAVVTLSTWVTMALKTEMVQTGITDTPIVFGGIVCPETLGFTSSPEHGNSLVTGVVLNTPSYKKQVETIKALCPTADKLLLPFDTDLTHGGYTETTIGASNQMGKQWRRTGGEVAAVPISAHEDIGGKIAATAKKGTVVNLSLESGPIVQTSSIVQACNDNGLILFAHDRTSVRRGAALGTGSSGDILGPGIAACLSAICVNGHDPQDVPLLTVNESQEVCFARSSLSSQGIELSGDDMLKLDMLPIECVE